MTIGMMVQRAHLHLKATQRGSGTRGGPRYCLGIGNDHPALVVYVLGRSKQGAMIRCHSEPIQCFGKQVQVDVER